MQSEGKIPHFIDIFRYSIQLLTIKASFGVVLTIQIKERDFDELELCSAR